MLHAPRSGPLPAAGRLPSARRLGLCAALGAAAAAVGRTPGVLLAFLAVMLLLDAVLPAPGRSWAEADDRFRRLARARRRAAHRRRLRGLPPERLPVLDDADGRPQRALGVESIPLAAVTGTVEAYKAHSFDAAFRPEPAAAEHWKRLWMAQARGATLPPISVYRVGQEHFVRDGHHRVSVARDLGSATIEADVVELGHRRAGPYAASPSIVRSA